MSDFFIGSLSELNNQFFDLQMRKMFPIDRDSPKICQYCGKSITQNDVDKCGFWVGANGTEYICVECDDEYKFGIIIAKSKCCSLIRDGKKPSIEQCVSCQKLHICEETAKNFEFEFKESKRND